MAVAKAVEPEHIRKIRAKLCFAAWITQRRVSWWHAFLLLLNGVEHRAENLEHMVHPVDGRSVQ